MELPEIRRIESLVESVVVVKNHHLARIELPKQVRVAPGFRQGAVGIPDPPVEKQNPREIAAWIVADKCHCQPFRRFHPPRAEGNPVAEVLLVFLISRHQLLSDADLPDLRRWQLTEMEITFPGTQLIMRYDLLGPLPAACP